LSLVARAAAPLSLALLACGLPSLAGRAADAPDEIAVAVDRAFRPLIAEYDVPGMAVGVTIDGRHYFFNFGIASKDTNKSVTQGTLFELGSVSKTLTATFACYAQALGKLSLEDHPGRFMPQLRGGAIDGASLLNLGTYTAGGLPLQVPDAVTNQAQMIGYFQQWKPDWAPGAQRRYSNLSIGLLGHVAGLAMNGDFADVIEAELFPRLGLAHSYIRPPAAAMAEYAWGYSKTNAPIRVNPGVFDAEAYGVKTTAADMLAFVEANIHPESLDGPIRRAIEGTHIGYFKIDAMTQGLGWEQYPYPIALDRLLAGNSEAMIMNANAATAIQPPRAPSQPTLFDKTGSTNGFGAYVAFVPEKKIGVVMLAIKNFPIPARVAAAHAVLAQLSQEAP
jgi:beta-lactamase class C